MISWDDFARRAGYTSKTGSVAHNLVRLLEPDGRISYAIAVKIVRGCDAYPVDYGI